ncbi:5-(carboxyamino)imidazole ribonucleotide synthase [uncultured Brevundimonas sp.]|uniref:5-(carboxyamino)imidazole ribonucleotide synthase n=1 Tax=uncultured Brevundimonas sp. TaxID=213418 RepID=UPI002605DAAA|nr:5-(carboxyamino)imidazole ribonucleotide synthase [uncultured Brevundimonas sp.]
MTALPAALAPGSTIGILGGGQLGRMLAEAASTLGFDVAILEPQADCPASRVAAHHIQAAYDDIEGLKRLAALSDVVTTEFENVPASVVAVLEAEGVRVAPNGRALATAQDRVDEKTFLNSVGATTVDFAKVDDLNDLTAAIEKLGLPALLKTRREGYDGKGQVWIKDAADAESALDAIGHKPAILEARAAFTQELSVIAARGVDGTVAVYPLGQNTHENGILRTTIAPAQVDPATQSRAIEIATAILNGLDYVGVIGVELFDLGGSLLVNEIAPRVHNTGHWTQDGCGCDQFEQQIRAIAGWPLGSTKAHARIEMTNLLGDEIDGWHAMASDPDTHLHFYGKREARAGRKMAHINKVLERL